MPTPASAPTASWMARLGCSTSPDPFDRVQLLEAFRQIPFASWSLPSTFAETGVHHGYRRVVLAELDPFRWVLNRFEPIREAWLSWIDPGGFIVPHADKGPH